MEAGAQTPSQNASRAGSQGSLAQVKQCLSTHCPSHKDMNVRPVSSRWLTPQRVQSTISGMMGVHGLRFAVLTPSANPPAI
eukprot:scaffold7418_cov31-Tisochrysis_lutea.AAC.4